MCWLSTNRRAARCPSGKYGQSFLFPPSRLSFEHHKHTKTEEFDGQQTMQTRKKKWVLLQTCGGFLSLIGGFALIGVLNWEGSVYIAVNLALGLLGVTLCIIGFRLFLIATEDDGLPMETNGAELGSIQLNGYRLVAYESETPDGKKQFRLRSWRPLTPQREAALIRYLAAEGFLGSLWPEIKERIEDEAGWAFLV